MDVSGCDSASAAPGLRIVQLGAGTPAPFPIVDRLWEMYSQKGIRTVFFSVGTSASPLADLELAESLGCPLHVVPLGAEERWAQVAGVLASRKRTGGTGGAAGGGDPATPDPFLEGVEKKWILPKNIRVLSALPWWTAGSVELGGATVPARPAVELVSAACETMKLADSSVRLDILKIDCTGTANPKLAGQIALAVLESGLRPSLLLVHWGDSPDVDVQSSVHAGCVQTMGYRLLAKDDRKFLYYYTDNDLLQCCSWEDSSCPNPMVREILAAARVATQTA